MMEDYTPKGLKALDKEPEWAFYVDGEFFVVTSVEGQDHKIRSSAITSISHNDFYSNYDGQSLNFRKGDHTRITTKDLDITVKGKIPFSVLNTPVTK